MLFLFMCFEFIRRDDPNTIISAMITLVQNKLEKESGGVTFRVGDKVMQIKNNYNIEWEVRNKYGIPVDKGTGIYNGDIGITRERICEIYQVKAE